MNILFLTHRVPHPPDRGDRIRSYHLLKFLSARAGVHLGCLADEPLSGETLAWLNRHSARLAVEPLGTWSRWGRAALSVMCGGSATEGLYRSPRLKRTVRDWAREREFDAVVVFCSSMWQYVDIPELADVPIIVDLVDVDSQKWFDYAAGASGWRRSLYQLEGRRVQRLEGLIARRAKAITLVSEAEAELFRGVWPNDKTLGVPNGVDLEYFNPEAVEPTSENYDCIFVGQLDYHPNVEGVRWFCQHVWPAIVQERPGATFAIVGRHPTAEIRKLAEQPGVKLIGEVPDVRPYLAAAKIAVAPLQIARGIQNKVLEAMAMGKPVVASPGALTGLPVENDVEVIASSTPQEWINRTLQLCASESARQQLGRAARDYVHRHHNWADCLSPFGAIAGLPTSNCLTDSNMHVAENIVSTP